MVISRSHNVDETKTTAYENVSQPMNSPELLSSSANEHHLVLTHNFQVYINSTGNFASKKINEVSLFIYLTS